ncbi:MAG TPA: sialate O-acetylesterase [Candidatus Limnocylindria bacterium]|nr:sialate O-acetylesterase [Candidatus Limnocylindria bacterium]
MKIKFWSVRRLVCGLRVLPPHPALSPESPGARLVSQNYVTGLDGVGFLGFWLYFLLFSSYLAQGQNAVSSSVPLATTTNGIVLTSPGNRVVFQRNREGKAIIPITGTSSLRGVKLEARLVPVDLSLSPGNWSLVTTVKPDGTFAGRLAAKAGWYGLEVRARSATGPATAMMGKVDRVGVGEVFVVVGHSVAQGGEVNLPGSTDDRVNTVALDTDQPGQQRDYEETGDPKYLPMLTGTPFTNGVQPAPFGHGTYIWAQFAERVARAEKVPVLIFNAAFGGTSLEHWAKSVRGERFEHSFVRSGIRMPYINVNNTLRRYIAVTGIRAILADQGQNDANEPSPEVVFGNYRAWVDQARVDLGFPQLAVVVNRQTPYPQRSVIRQAEERMIREVPHCFPGPDYDRFASEDRPDGIHLGPLGAEKAAQWWAEALDVAFFSQSLPYQPR